MTLCCSSEQWRIGDDRQIRIWRDPWIPRADTHRLTTLRERNHLRRVADLFNSEGTDGDIHRICSTFNPTDVEAIAKIQLMTRRTEDFLAWQPEKSEMFSVRSAYDIALREIFGTHRCIPK